jgi:tetratricopeptide (TPR) repeat protein
VEFYCGRGQARLQMGDYLGARDDYSRALELRPEASILVHRGWAYFFVDAWKPALRDFEEAIRREPHLADAYIGRGLTCLMLGRYRDAVADAEQAVYCGPTTPQMYHNLACLFALAAEWAAQEPAEDLGPAAAARYRDKALKAVANALALVPPEQRQSFWRTHVLPDPALASLRHCAAFRVLPLRGLRP